MFDLLENLIDTYKNFYSSTSLAFCKLGVVIGLLYGIYYFTYKIKKSKCPFRIMYDFLISLFFYAYIGFLTAMFWPFILLMLPFVCFFIFLPSNNEDFSLL